MWHVNTIEWRRTFSFTFTRSNRKRAFWETRLSHKKQTLCFWLLINPTSNRLGLLQWDSTSTTDNEHSHRAHTRAHVHARTHISSASALLLISVCLHKHAPPSRRWLTRIQGIHIKQTKKKQHRVQVGTTATVFHVCFPTRMQCGRLAREPPVVTEE